MARHRYQYGKRAVWQKRMKKLRNLTLILLPIGVLIFLLLRSGNLKRESGADDDMTVSQEESLTEETLADASEEIMESETETETEEELDLPLLTFYYYYFSYDEVDGEILKDISDAVVSRDGTFDNIGMLPVYRNLYYRNYEEQQEVDYQGLHDRAAEIKEAFSLTGVEGAVDTPGSTGRAPSYTAVTADYELTVFEGGDVRLSFRNKIDLPEGFVYEYSLEKELALVDYYLELLAEPLLQCFGRYDKKEVTVSYLPSGAAIYYISNYQSKADGEDGLLSHEFDNLWLYTQSDGLYGLFYSKQRPAAEALIAEYPVITSEMAIREFQEGNYAGYGGVAAEALAYGEVKGVRLEYFYKAYQEYILPVYVIYVGFTEEALPDLYDEELAEGLETYIRFYVPAVPMRYIERMETVFHP